MSTHTTDPVSTSNLELSDATVLVPFGVACKHCGYDLKQQPVGGKCPQCSGVCSESLQGYSPEWNVADSRPCLNCEYDLSGQALNGVCPECGVPLLQSVNGNLLKYSGYTYVNELMTGSKHIYNSVLAFLLAYVVVLVPILIAMVNPVAGGLLGLIGIFAFIGCIIACLYFGVSGWNKFTQPDPSNLTNDSGENVRKITRVAFYTYVTTVIVAILGGILGAAGFVALGMLAGLANIVSSLAFVLLLIGTMKYMQRLAYRVPNVKLRKVARSTEQVMLAVVLGIVTMLASAIASLFLGEDSAALFVMTGGVGMVLAIFGSLFALVGFTRTTRMAGKLLEDVAQSADIDTSGSPSASFGVPLPSEAA
ncbi:MAG: hypothetical protein ACYTF7_06150 [Planctomycetota bacterium]|jgi:Zn finger protein HypA/HybF involved in hydrogenase expression